MRYIHLLFTHPSAPSLVKHGSIRYIPSLYTTRSGVSEPTIPIHQESLKTSLRIHKHRSHSPSPQSPICRFVSAAQTLYLQLQAPRPTIPVPRPLSPELPLPQASPNTTQSSLLPSFPLSHGPPQLFSPPPPSP